MEAVLTALSVAIWIFAGLLALAGILSAVMFVYVVRAFFKMHREW